MHVFGGCGFFSVLLSFLTFVWMVVLRLFYSAPFITTPLPLVVVMTFMVGMMCILLGLLAEMIMRTFYESQGKAIYSARSVRNIEPALPAVQGTGAPGGDQALRTGAARMGK